MELKDSNFKNNYLFVFQISCADKALLDLHLFGSKSGLNWHKVTYKVYEYMDGMSTTQGPVKLTCIFRVPSQDLNVLVARALRKGGYASV